MFVDIKEAIKKREESGTPPDRTYTAEKVDERGQPFTITTTVELLGTWEVVIPIPKPDLSKDELAKLSADERAERAKLGRFRRANAKVVGPYLTANRFKVEIMLVDGLMPTITTGREANDLVTGRAEIKVKRVTSTTGEVENLYFFIKVFPSTAKPTHRVIIFSDEAELSPRRPGRKFRESDESFADRIKEHEKRLAAFSVRQERRKADMESCEPLMSTDSLGMSIGLISLKPE